MRKTHFQVGTFWIAKDQITYDPEQWKDKYRGQAVLMVGKGPSLDHFADVDLRPYSLIVCINESMKIVEERLLFADTGFEGDVFWFQQDARLNNGPYSDVATGIVNYRAAVRYTDEQRARLVIYAPSQFGLEDNALTTLVAIHWLSHCGTHRPTLFAFDGVGGYAKTLQLSATEYGGKLERFAAHRSAIADLIEKLPFHGTSDSPVNETLSLTDRVCLSDSDKSNLETDDQHH